MVAYFLEYAIEDLKGEQWRSIQGYDGKYLVSSLGRVKSLKGRKPRILHQHMNNNGYLRVALSCNGNVKYYLIHRLVAEAYLHNDDPEVKTTVDHKDRQKTNNCVTNLRYLSLAENIREYFRTRHL